MITSVSGLQKARARWLSAGKDPKLFDTAVSALDSATTNVDVIRLLPPPTFSVRAINGSTATQADVWQIFVNGDLMLGYELQEASSDADVTVIA